jgi:hypothetical protein
MTNDEGMTVLPSFRSEVEESRDDALELFCEILRLRCAPLRMTVLPSFVLRDCFVIRISSLATFMAY